MKPARISDVRPEFVFLGLLAERPVHGYELYRRFREAFGSLWHISESQMYATLKRLDSRGWIAEGGIARDLLAPGKYAESGGDTAGSSGAVRRTLTITDAGHAAFSQWLSTPSAASPRALRLEFLTRLHFASRSLDVAPLIAAQRAVLEAELQGLPSIATPAGTVETRRIGALAADFRMRQVRAALEWLDTLNFS